MRTACAALRGVGAGGGEAVGERGRELVVMMIGTMARRVTTCKLTHTGSLFVACTCSTRLYRMTVSLRLDLETERLVNRLARARRQTKSDVIREALRALAREESTPRSGPTVYDALAHHIGCFDSGGLNLSSRTGQRFAALLAERTRGRRPR